MPIGGPEPLPEYEEGDEQISDNLTVNFKAKLQSYPNIETTRYNFDV